MKGWTGWVLLWAVWLVGASSGLGMEEKTRAEQVDAAIVRGVEYLLPRQYADGSWRMAGHEAYPGGTTALACYALYKSGLPKEHAAIQLSMNFLASAEPVYVYDAALRVLLLTSMDPVKYAPRIERAAKVLNYGPRQYFSYEANRGRDVTGDLSNHQYGLVGLEALDRFGFDTDEDFWGKTSEFMVRNMADMGGWGYYPNQEPSSTMVLAGIAGAACCLKALQRNEWKPKVQKQLQQVLTTSLSRAEGKWFLDQPMNRAPLNRWFYYACYGVERAMAILDQKALGQINWYAQIADAIVERQRKNGSWSSAKGEPEMNTAFALLTLSRATASTGGGGGEESQLWQRKWISNTEGAWVQVAASGLPQCTVFLTNFDTEWMADLRWPQEQSARIRRVQWMLNGEVVLDLSRDQEQWQQDCRQLVPHRFGGQISLPGNGAHTLHARIEVMPDGEDWQWLESAAVDLDVSGIADEQFTQELRFRDQHAQPLGWAAKEIEIEASSAFGGSAGAGWALDRCHATAWRWKSDDNKRLWQAKWKKAFRADGIRIVPALPADQSLDGYAMPQRLRLKINGSKSQEIEFSQEDWRNGYIFPFRKSQKIRRIELEVTSIHQSRSSGVGGISEIEFFCK